MFTDAAGRSTAVTKPGGTVWRTEFDVMDRPIRVIDPLQGETLLTYDANGNGLSLTDARGGVTSSTYDASDRRVTETDPLIHTQSTTYDLGGHVLSITDRNGQVTRFEYDALGRRVLAGFGAVGTPPSVTYQSTINYVYDAGNRLIQVVDSVSGTTTMEHDGLDRLLSQVSPQGAVTMTYRSGRATRDVPNIWPACGRIYV